MKEGLRIDFPRGENDEKLFGSFIRTGIHGMPEASEHKQIDSVLPVFGESVDFCCRNSSWVLVTEVLTRYIDLTDYIF